MRNLIYFLALISMMSCRRTTMPSVAQTNAKVVSQEISREISFQLANLTAYDIQENVNLKDELWVEYNLVAIKDGKILRMETASRFLGAVRQGDKIALDTISALRMQLYPGEQLGVQVSLWELDDYTKDQQLLNQVNQWGGMLQVPLMLVEWSSASNPISWFLWGARLSSLGLHYWSKQDGRDLLGVSELQWDWSSLPKGKSTRFKRGNWKGGKAGLDAYQYEYAYRIHVNQ